ncbi:MAG: 3-hydroxyacyl-CoA dehydrogenase family protein [Myxococcota bacterium]
MEFEKVTVIGSGTMGHGIAQVCAQADYKVTMYDPNPDVLHIGLKKIVQNLDKGIVRQKVTPERKAETLSHITISSDLKEAATGAELVIEAIPEQLDLKQAVLRQFDELTPEHTIFASNTSSISIAEIATALSDPTRFLGAHFFNPVHIMQLIEVIYHETTGVDVIDAIKGFGRRLGKQPIVVRNTPGFATSRLGVALGMEAIRMLEQGVATAEDIDKAMELGYRHPMGPLKLTDLVGLDVRMAIGEYLAKTLKNPAFEPPELMRRMVEQGKLGKKTKEGFYRW